MGADKANRTYGELMKHERLSPEDEQVLRRVYGLVPMDGEKTSELRVSAALTDVAQRRVTHWIDFLRTGGLVSTGRGGSRSVSRNLRDYPSEHSLYPDMRAEIATRWADEWPHDFIESNRFCEVLGTHGMKRGRWNAPDITLVGGKTLPFLPGKFLDVVTFEVKPKLDITGLYEALSHRTHATHAYLICHHGASAGEPDVAAVGRISREAQRTGVGFILARQPDDYATWDEIAPATRWSPEPEMLHDFIRDLGSLDRRMLGELRAWLRSDPFSGSRPAVNFSELGLSKEDERLAENIYLEIPVGGSLGWAHFKGWIDRRDVERIRELLKKKGIIETRKGGGMKLPG